MAKKFTFRMQGVLNIKQFKQQLLKQDLAKLLENLYSEKGKLNMLMVNLRKANQKLRQHLVKDIGSINITFFNQYIEYLGKGIDEQKRKIAAMEEVIREKRNQIREAEKEKKVLEKLKDRQFNDYCKKIKVKLQKNSDETSIQRFKNGGEVWDGTFTAN